MKNQLKEMQKAWGLFHVEKNGVLELRAIRPEGTPYQLAQRALPVIFRVSDFEDVDDFKRAFERKAIELNNMGFNIYTLLNRIRHDFDGDSAKDVDITHRLLFYVDIDRVKKEKQPASDEEIAEAEKLGDKIQNFLSGQGWPLPTRVMSGNGAHLYYQLDYLENTDESSSLIRNVLKAIAAEFNSDKFKVDTVVHNPSRITKFPGTIAYKGQETEGRPYRMAFIHD